MRACFHCVKSLDSNLTNSKHSIVLQSIKTRIDTLTLQKTETHFTIRSLCQWNMHDARRSMLLSLIETLQRMPKVQTLCAHTFRIIRNEILNDCFIRQFIHMKRFEPLQKEKRSIFHKIICWLRIFPTKNFKWTSLGRVDIIGSVWIKRNSGVFFSIISFFWQLFHIVTQQKSIELGETNRK